VTVFGNAGRSRAARDGAELTFVETAGIFRIRFYVILARAALDRSADSMARQITPDEIRGADLGRSIRGYDRRQTEQFLADVAEAQERLIAQRDALAQQAEALRSESSERDVQAKQDVAALNTRLEKSQRRALELEAELDRLQKTRSRDDEESQRVREELARAQAALAEQRAELAEHEEIVVRLRTREKALSEQLRMMETEARARAEDVTEQTTTVEERALLALAQVEQAAEKIEREARGQLETILTETRERAHEITGAAERSTATEPAQDDDVRAPEDEALSRDDQTPPELDTTVTRADGTREPVHRPEFDAPAAPDLSFDLRPAPHEPRQEPDDAGSAEEDATFPLTDYRDLDA
jgi:chromosome segregation ATPase